MFLTSHFPAATISAMRRKKGYEPRCPAVACGANRAFLYKVSPEDVAIPAQFLATKDESEVVYHCNYCKLVWIQPKDAPPGLDPRPQGYYDDRHLGPHMFFPLKRRISISPDCIPEHRSSVRK